MSVYTRLEELQISLPPVATPAAAYVPFAQTGNLVFISGHISKKNGQVWAGQLGKNIQTEEGKAAAKACAVMLIAQMKAALGGDLDRVERIVKLGVFVASTPDFTDQPEAANGASDLMEAVFGDAGKHARAAVSVPVLPRDATVEIDCVVKVRS